MSAAIRKLLAPFEFADDEWANIQKYSDVFDSYDKSGDGNLDVGELQALLDSSPVKPKPSASKVIEATDMDHDKIISKREFLLGVTGCSKEQKYLCMFNSFDKDGDGRISTSEILESLGTAVDKRSLDVAKKLIAELDRDGDGYLNPEEFAQKFARKQCS